ncbi:uncharacterized protein LOC119385782 [Rhipicephalus sanguineus]|uniref:Uncharacterized protein n=1 Tax=Rhipicephalus sanguineus TaxID=34632 RepID=A0A9D4T0E3_RHISA|nr:uncharacterized protein LOC119385782 [Rhipicephalus sanguineus]KAH7961557.1 hypothetical protein HPB52_010423 [Rhipicephalus sanguineus]
MTIHYDGYLLKTPGCSLPLYNPYHWIIRRYFAENATYEALCASRNLTVFVQDFNRFTIDSDALRRGYNVSDRDIYCYYREVFRDNNASVPDTSIVFGPPVLLTNGSTVEAEYVQISCKTNGSLLFEDYFFVPQPKKRLHESLTGPAWNETALSRKTNSTSILILGLDSTSRMNFHRHMKRTRKFLKQDLSAFEFIAFNKVGDASFANLIPLLTGLAGHDAESLIARSQMVEVLPFVWNLYKSRGYATAYVEEMPHYGLFTYPNFTGFARAPAEYYPVSILRLMDETHFDERYCVGSRLKTKALVDYVGQVLKINRHEPMFSFVWLSYLTHNHVNGLQIMDGMLEDFIRELSEHAVLENTALFFIGDHGPRIGPFRIGEIGRYEDKNPVCFLALPKRFLAEHPEAAVQLEVNQRRLVTHYDLHATLVALSSLPALGKGSTNMGLSLMDRIPPERTCADAFVPSEFCACFGDRVNLEGNRVATSFARYAVSYINALAELHFPGRCILWELDTVQESSVLGGRVAGKVLLRVVITTRPTAHFEVYGELRGESPSQENHVNFLHRLDWYSNETQCLPESRWQKICACRPHI